MGGNMFAGGSGGSGTAGLGGRGGPYRLDAGQQLGHMTQQEKDAVDDASLAAAKDMATKAHAKKLEELGFGPAEASAYEAARDAVLLGATELRAALLDREKRDRSARVLGSTAPRRDPRRREGADERFVFLISDADLKRYGIDAANWNAIIMKDPKVQAFVLLISSNDDEAAGDPGQDPPGPRRDLLRHGEPPDGLRHVRRAVLKLS
ncbi:midasin-like protein [Aureococcus anophagefferens]|uniref:Midasin-like protein n=1 Tax=Aureococcus anophagefferens TaxID=44056 RepID=A0ABR1FKS3_AURAN